ncbi:hypothetical protein HC766_03135 [Candidatus Gracilibacteria bacterium]|nr:hypothetical protein [Candidatus Gracilibacteria bacterium]
MMIYFVGIGGTGISPLAGLAIDCNMDIAGSDVGESLGTKEIAKRGVKINYLQDGEYLEVLHKKTRIDWLVHTAAVELDHLELRKAKELGIRVTKEMSFGILFGERRISNLLLWQELMEKLLPHQGLYGQGNNLKSL